jgi:hypothetical protein
MKYLWRIQFRWDNGTKSINYVVTKPCDIQGAIEKATEAWLEGWNVEEIKLLTKDVIV